MARAEPSCHALNVPASSQILGSTSREPANQSDSHFQPERLVVATLDFSAQLNQLSSII